ncbi:Zinc finger protein ush [Amphibalanus amphitrite]|uniref:Zinc finger protein ush n=1 Tax=Amphibalanus amphitrite TaxID=1232801 RepID=A0A6A4UXQ4_AMPAM|nr:Zinc finger protein ush [Amphibalanus amphitrite]
MFVSAEIKSEPGSPRGERRSPQRASTSPSSAQPTYLPMLPGLQTRGMLCSCGINFSSLSTLAAHQKYYCTNRPNADDTPEPVVGGTEPVVSPGPSESSVSEAACSQTDAAAKRRVFACPKCAFTTDKANGLNRHMRIHVPPAGGTLWLPPLQERRIWRALDPGRRDPGAGSSSAERRSRSPEPSFRISIKPPDTISESDSVTSRRPSELAAEPATEDLRLPARSPASASPGAAAAYYCTSDEAGKVAAAVAVAAVAAGQESGRRSAPRSHPALATGWKCPCCDVYSPTAAAAQKHLETHNNVRAFKCSLCGYKGNTLRGMRTHIRMHFMDKKSPDLSEENFITCIVANSDEEESGREDRTEKCPLCSFKSGHPETMLKHFTLAHPRSRSRVSTAPSMIEHRRRGSGSPLASRPSEKCPHCSFYTNVPETMLTHQRQRHPERLSPPPDGILARLARGSPEAGTGRSTAPPPASPAGERPPSSGNTNGESPAPDSLHCHHCKIAFKQVASYAAHTQFYCPGRTASAVRSVTPVQ